MDFKTLGGVLGWFDAGGGGGDAGEGVVSEGREGEFFFLEFFCGALIFFFDLLFCDLPFLGPTQR